MLKSGKCLSWISPLPLSFISKYPYKSHSKFNFVYSSKILLNFGPNSIGKVVCSLIFFMTWIFSARYEVSIADIKSIEMPPILELPILRPLYAFRLRVKITIKSEKNILIDELSKVLSHLLEDNYKEAGHCRVSKNRHIRLIKTSWIVSSNICKKIKYFCFLLNG